MRDGGRLLDLLGACLRTVIYGAGGWWNGDWELGAIWVA